MNTFACALANTISRQDGLLLLEVPDAMDSGFLVDLVRAANQARTSTDGEDYAILLAEGPGPGGVTSVDSRGLPGYRQGHRLVVCHRKEYRAHSTFSSTLPPALPGDFPRQGASAGLLDQVAEESASLLLGGDSTPGDEEALALAIAACMRFLAGAYEVEADSGVEWRARWWQHAERALKVLASLESPTPGDAWAAFGLPQPGDGSTYSRSHDAKAYVKVLVDGWADPADMPRRFEAASQPEPPLDYIDGLRSQFELRLTVDQSIVVGIARPTDEEVAHPTTRLDAWRRVSEELFFNPWKAATALVEFTLHGRPPPGTGIWDDILILPHPDEASAGGHGKATCTWSGVSIACPGMECPATAVLEGLEAAAMPLILAGAGSAAWSGDLKLMLPRARAVRTRLLVTPTDATVPGIENTVVLPPAEAGMVLLRPASTPGARRRPAPKMLVVQDGMGEPGEAEEEVIKTPGAHEILVVDGEGSAWEFVDADGHRTTGEADPDHGAWTFQVQIQGGERLLRDDEEVVTFLADDSVARPANPLVAAAMKVMPQARVPAALPLLGKLDVFLTAELRRIAADSPHLGHVVVRLDGEILHARPELSLANGIFEQGGILQGAANLVEWALPTSKLIQGEPARRLRAAYAALDLHRACVSADAPDGTPISLLPLRDIPEAEVNELLEAYVALVSAAEEGEEDGDAFWARYPFSVVVLDQDRNRVRAILISPVHPLRLAWRWSVERGIYDLPGSLTQDIRCKLVELVDGSQFPLAGPSLGNGRLVAVPIDAGRDQVFLGWSGLVRSMVGDPERLAIPSLVAGEPAPFAATSGLNEPSVGAALRDFKRLHPEVSTLVVDMAASTRVPRAPELDRAVASVARSLALDEATGLPGGLRVRDSRYREGMPDSSALIGDGGPGPGAMKLEWKSYDPADPPVDGSGDAHVRFLQDSPVALAAVDVDGNAAESGLALVPIRRVVARDISARRWRFSPRTRGAWAPFREALGCLESTRGGSPIAITVDRQFAAFDSRNRARWYVAGDAFLDPRSLQAVASEEGPDLLLWEWRPGFATAGKVRQPKIGERPYVVVCRFPSSIRRRVDDLARALEGGAPPAGHASMVVKALAARGIGLNTLLTRDENHAVGALGFYWTLGLLRAWIAGAQDGVRLCVPMDAVDGLIGLASAAGGPSETHMRADLLLLDLRRVGATGAPQAIELTMLPVEIKAHISPDGDQSSQAIEQVVATYWRLESLVAADGQGPMKAWVRAVIGTMLEAGLTLAPEVIEGYPRVSDLLCPVIVGDAALRVAPGVAIEFTPGAGDARWWEDSSQGARAAMARVDTAGIWAEASADKPSGPASKCLVAALEWSMAPAGDARAPAGAPTGPAASGQGPGTPPTTPPPGAPPDALPPEAGPGASSAESNPEGNVGAGAPIPDTSPALLPAQGEPASPPPSPIIAPTPAAPLPGAQGRPVAPPDPGRRQELARRHALIMRVLGEFSVRVEPPSPADTPFIEGPAVVRYKVRPGRGVQIGRIEAHAEELKLRLGLPAMAQVSVRVNESYVEIEVPKPDSERAYFKAEALWAGWRPAAPPELSAPVGVDEDGRTVAIDLASSMSPHLLIGGQTGSGKSQVLLTLLAGLMRFHEPARLRLALIDPKRTEFWAFSDSPHLLKPIMNTAEEAASILEAAVREMEERYRQLQARRQQGIAQWEATGDAAPPHWVIVIDEYGELTAVEADKRRLEALLVRLGQAARAAGIHVVIATQRPDAQVISANLRANLAGKLALRVRSHNESRIILGDSGAESLAGNGDALLCYGPHRIRLQCALAPTTPG